MLLDLITLGFLGSFVRLVSGLMLILSCSQGSHLLGCLQQPSLTMSYFPVTGWKFCSASCQLHVAEANRLWRCQVQLQLLGRVWRLLQDGHHQRHPVPAQSERTADQRSGAQQLWTRELQLWKPHLVLSSSSTTAPKVARQRPMFMDRSCTMATGTSLSATTAVDAIRQSL
jgi:hypothetical protein